MYELTNRLCLKVMGNKIERKVKENVEATLKIYPSGILLQGNPTASGAERILSMRELEF